MNHYMHKVAIVTGGASGIGRAVAQQLLAGGAKRVVVADIDEPRAEATARDLGRGAVAAGLDVTDAAQVDALVTQCANEHGLDLMFNNAGIAIAGDADQLTLDDHNRLIDVNIRGVVHGTMAALQCMRQRGSGHIVNTASLAGLIPAPGFAAYALTKHAVVGYSKSLRIEAQPYGVRVTAVCPGFIDTPMFHNSELRGRPAAERERLKKVIPLYPAKECAREILAGVAKNRAVVTVTRAAKVATALHRAAPEASFHLMQRQYKKMRGD